MKNYYPNYKNTSNLIYKANKFPKIVHFEDPECTLDSLFNGGRDALFSIWNVLKQDLADNIVQYDDTNKLLSYQFFHNFDQLVQKNIVKENMCVDLSTFKKCKKFFRAVKLNPNENVNFSRFVPDASKMKSDNRFSPMGVEWLYLAFDHYETDAKKCCLKEIRANSTDNVCFCKFVLSGNPKVIDLTITSNKSFSDITFQKIKTDKSDAPIMFVLEAYCKLIETELFKPIETENKTNEYLPFQSMASYFKYLGYDGIIYSSTVSSCGKNIVLFEKNILTPYEIIY